MRIPPKLARVRILFFPLYLCHSFVRNPTTKTYICPLTTQDVSMLFFVCQDSLQKVFRWKFPTSFFFPEMSLWFVRRCARAVRYQSQKRRNETTQKKKMFARFTRSTLVVSRVSIRFPVVRVGKYKKWRRNLCFDRYAIGSRRQGSKAQNKTVTLDSDLSRCVCCDAMQTGFLESGGKKGSFGST